MRTGTTIPISTTVAVPTEGSEAFGKTVLSQPTVGAVAGSSALTQTSTMLGPVSVDVVNGEEAVLVFPAALAPQAVMLKDLTSQLLSGFFLNIFLIRSHYE